MNQNIDPILRADLQRVAEIFPHWEELRNKSVFITGATGLVGSMLVRCLCAAPVGITVIAHVRNEQKARAMFGDLPVRYCVGDVTTPIRYEGAVDHILHTASVTASKTFVTQPVDTLMTAIDGTRNLLEFAREKAAESMVYVSSMEAFGITDPALERVTEQDLGYIDILSVRSSYSEGKRICECLCAAYAAQYGVHVRIARLAQTFGAGVSRADGRVFAQFTKSCLEGRDIVLHTEGKSMGNYCYTADCIRGLLTIALKGEDGSYLMSPNPVEPRQMQLAVGPYVLPVKVFDKLTMPSTGTKAPMILGDLKAGIAYWQKKALAIKPSDVAVAGDLNAYEQDLILWRGSMWDDCTTWDTDAFVNGFIDTAST